MFTRIKKVLDMKALGKMILSVEWAQKPGLKAPNMRDFMLTAKNRVKEHTLGSMDQFTLVTGMQTELMEEVTTSGKTVESTLVNGVIMTCTELESTSTLMESPMRVSIEKIKKLAMDYTTGPIEESMKAGGTRANNMDWAFIRTQIKQRSNTACGNTARGSLGTMKRRFIR